MKLKTPSMDTREIVVTAPVTPEDIRQVDPADIVLPVVPVNNHWHWMEHLEAGDMGEESTEKHGEAPQPDDPLPIMEGKIVLNSPHRGLRIEAEALAALAYAPDEVIAMTIREAAREAGFKIGDEAGPPGAAAPTVETEYSGPDLAETMRASAPTKEERGADAPRNDKEGQKKREVYPDIYDHSNKPFLFSRLFDYAEWAECNEWEVPLCLADDLRAAAKFIRFMGEQHPDVCAHDEEAKKGADK